jgi:hypothetical protein
MIFTMSPFELMIMKTKRFLIPTLLLAAGLAARAADSNMLSLAVFDFDARQMSSPGLGSNVADILNAMLSADPNIITVERAELGKVLGEHELGLSGTVSSDTAPKIGQLTGAKVLVTGSVFTVDNETTIVAKIIGTETSRVYGDMVSAPKGNSISDLSKQLAKKISDIVSQKGGTLVAKVLSRDERIDRIVKGLKGEKRPGVSIKLAERHFGQPVIDPAAETELASILQKAGFTILDDKSEKKPDIEITGEAFSAYGMRKGNLISCRSRIEIKAREREGGKILSQDSQMSVGVDIAEQTAAKASLQNAALELAERLVPKLTQ